MRRLFALALALDLVGGAGVLLLSTRRWQTITTARPAPLHDDVLQVSGRAVDGAPTALALVALAGVVAVLATRGIARRIVGGVLAVAGVALIWRAAVSASAVSADRARSLVRSHHPAVDTSGLVPQVNTHVAWAVLTIVCGVVVSASGALIAWRGNRWQVMSVRYETPQAHQADPAKTAATLWTALDRGEDPTD